MGAAKTKAVFGALQEPAKKFYIGKLGDDALAEFAVEVTFLTIEFIEETIEFGRVPTAGDLSLFLAKKLTITASLSNDQRIRCGSAITDFFVTGIELSAELKPWAKLVLAGQLLTISSVNVWGECWIPISDQRQIEAAVAKVRKTLDSRKAQAAAILATKFNDSKSDQLFISLFSSRLYSDAICRAPSTEIRRP